MSAPFMPHRFDDQGNLALDKVNDSLKKLSRDIRKNLDARYTHSRHVFDLAGLTNASAAALLQYAIRRQNTNQGLEVIGVELYIAAADTQTWTLSCSDTTWPSISLVDVNNVTTTFAFTSSGVPVSVPSTSSDVVFSLSCSGASTIVAGCLVIHTRCDRGNQNDAFTYYVPSLINSRSSVAGSLLDTELTAAEAAVTSDTTADKDVSVECFVARNLAAASTLTWRIPSTGRRLLGAVCYVVQAVGGTVDFKVDANTISPSGTGATTRAAVTATLVGTQVGVDPTNTANDTIVSITANTQTAVLAYMLLFWS